MHWFATYHSHWPNFAPSFPITNIDQLQRNSKAETVSLILSITSCRVSYILHCYIVQTLN